MVDPYRTISFPVDQKLLSFINTVHKQHPPAQPNVLHQRVLTLDPGETTGYAYYHPLEGALGTIHVSQQLTDNIGQSYEWLYRLLDPTYAGRESGAGPFPEYDHLRYEDYRVYEWKTKDHAWSPVHTIRWIGAIQVAAHVTETPNSCIMASHAKAFWTDQKLDMFGVNPKGLRHGRDALRHLLYYLCFPPKAT